MAAQSSWLSALDSLGSTFGKVYTAVNPIKTPTAPTATPQTSSTPAWLLPVTL